MILHPIIDLLKRIVIALPDYVGGGGGMKLLHETAPLTESVKNNEAAEPDYIDALNTLGVNTNEEN